MTDLSQPVWSALLAAARHDWTGDESLVRNVDGVELVIRQDHWQSSDALAPADREALDLLLPIAGSSKPFCLAQLGQSLDGRIATSTGDSFYINGPETRAHLHRLRALADAVVIGAGTAIADLPQLTVRHVEGSDPVRVIIDPSGRVPFVGPMFEKPDAPVLQLVATGLAPVKTPVHVRRVEIQSGENGFEPAAILAALHAEGLQRILIEGGGATVSRFIEANALDCLHLLIAPLLIGSGRSGIELPPIDRLAEAGRLSMTSFPIGGEVVVAVRF